MRSEAFVVDQVVTAGAPGSQVHLIPEGTRVLSLEDRADPVALLGSLINARVSNRLTVVFDGGDDRGAGVVRRRRPRRRQRRAPRAPRRDRPPPGARLPRGLSLTRGRARTGRAGSGCGTPPSARSQHIRVSEKDIMDINAILSLGGGLDYFTRDNFDKQSLIQDIEKYKTIKQSLSALEEQNKGLEKETIKLEKDKEKLEKYMSFYTSFLYGSYSD